MAEEFDIIVEVIDEQETFHVVSSKPEPESVDLDGYATEEYVDNAVDDMATQTWVDEQIGDFKPIVALTQAEYDALGTPDENTLYLITDAL